MDIHSEDKAESERLLKEELMNQLSTLDQDVKVIFKLSLPTEANFYRELMEDPHVVRIVALSGGYTQEEANEKLAHNHGIIASFSRALTEGLTVNQTDEEFNTVLSKSIQNISKASNI